MRQIQHALSVLILLLLVGVSLAATVEVVRQGWPDPPDLEQGDWVQVLSEHDVRAESNADQLRLVRRIEAELDRNFNWQQHTAGFSPTRWKLLQQNFTYLAGVWFRDQVKTYHELPEHRRQKFVDSQMRNMLRWRPPERALAETIAASQTHSDQSPRRRRRPRFSAEVIGQFQHALAQMGPDERIQAESYLAAVQQRLLQRTLDRMQPPAPGQ